MEGEDKVSKKEDEQGHEPEHDNLVTPAHIGRDSAACLPFGDGMARGHFGIAPPLGSCSECNGRSYDDADGLPQGEERHEVAAILRKELECDRSVDGDITSEAQGCQEIDSANGTVVVLGSSLFQGQSGRSRTSARNTPAASQRSSK